MAKRGRKSKYENIDLKQVKRIASLNLTDKQIAKALGICEKTLNTYKKQHPEFLQSLKAGKKLVDDKVVASLFQRAVGYSHPDVHISNYQGNVTKTAIIKHYPPDVAACFIWLKNRQPDQWRDRVEHSLTGEDGRPIKIKITKRQRS